MTAPPSGATQALKPVPTSFTSCVSSDPHSGRGLDTKWRAHPSGSDTSLIGLRLAFTSGAPSLLETLPSLLSTLGDDELEIIFGKLPRSDPLP